MHKGCAKPEPSKVVKIHSIYDFVHSRLNYKILAKEHLDPHHIEMKFLNSL